MIRQDTLERLLLAGIVAAALLWWGIALIRQIGG